MVLTVATGAQPMLAVFDSDFSDLDLNSTTAL